MKLSSEEALLEAVKTLIAIPSTADNPAGLRAAYEYMRELVRGSGKAITMEEFESGGKPSFLAYRGQTRPDSFHIILNAHVDVVPGKPEQYMATVRNGKLYGRGVYDMKAAAVILAQVFCEYVDKVPYALGLQIVTDEEVGGTNGTFHQIKEGVRANFVICGECGRNPGTYEIANEAKGIAAIELCLQGSSAHGAYPWQGDNAALKAADFIQRLHEFYPTPEQTTGKTTLTVTSVSAASEAHNQTPGSAIVKLDGRYAPEDPRFRSKEHVVALIKAIDPEAEVVTFYSFSPPMRTSPQNPLLLELRSAAEQVEGAEFSFTRRNGSSDGRFYTEVGGQACEFGIAGNNQHGDDECIPLTAFHDYLVTMRSFVQRVAALQPAHRSPAAQSYRVPALRR